ncbi:MAG: putative quinol monooxygenase [Lachnospiraceae bacterium]|nr:putative quinol monooxygenase [Lachnospiraceae bacterium]MDD3615049.1 putative quinol monooxygenase [Lachnospiraceae bacterium]
MLVVYAKCIVSGLNVENFLKLAKELIEETRKEPDNVSYELIQDKTGKNVYAILERWPNQEALDAHMKTKHFTTLIPQIEKLAIGGVDIMVHDLLI